MSVDLRKVKKLIELVEESGIAELEVRDGDETIRIARHIENPAGQAVAAPPANSLRKKLRRRIAAFIRHLGIVINIHDLFLLRAFSLSLGGDAAGAGVERADKTERARQALTQVGVVDH